MKKHKKSYVLEIEIKDKIIRIENPRKVKIEKHKLMHALKVKDKQGRLQYIGCIFFINDIERAACKVYYAIKNKENRVYLDIYYNMLLV